MRLVPFLLHGEGEVWVNPEHVARVYPSSAHSNLVAIRMRDGKTTLYPERPNRMELFESDIAAVVARLTCSDDEWMSLVRELSANKRQREAEGAIEADALRREAEAIARAAEGNYDVEEDLAEDPGPAEDSESADAPKVVDLMAALEASLQAAKDRRRLDGR